MEIIILGTGCKKCETLYENVKKAVEKTGIKADVVKQEDIMEIMKYNVLTTPAMVVNGVVKLSGYLPSEKEIITILTDNNISEELKIKEMVKQKYSEIALQGKEESCCCSNKTSKVYHIMSEGYDNMEGYDPDADLGLGCGLPTQFAHIKKGDTVVDLGSGAGNDCFVARAETGENGKVIGVDFALPMIEKARENAAKRGYTNVEFREGDIENMPIESDTADVIVSNCVLNLVPNKKAVFEELHRVLKPNGHFSISDIVLTGSLPPKIKSAAEMYAGCVASAILKEEYLSYIQQAGFRNITIQKDKPIIVPDDILAQYLSESEIAQYKQNATVIRSLTVYAEK